MTKLGYFGIENTKFLSTSVETAMPSVFLMRFVTKKERRSLSCKWVL